MKKLMWLLLAAMLGSSSCGLEAKYFEIGRAEKKWNAFHLSTYAFELTRFCECISPRVYVRVEDNVVARVVEVQTGRQIAVADVPWVRTIDGYFEMLRNLPVTTEKWQVEYDQMNGYPRSIAIDPSLQVADDEVSYSIDLLTRD